MKITFQNFDANNDIQNANSANRKAAFNPHHSNADNMRQASASNTLKNGIRLDMGNGKLSQNGLNNNSIFADSVNKNGKSITELQLEAGAIDSGIDKNYRTVMSNIMSEEDYEQAQKEGFDYSSMDPDDIVTIQDKVKAELAKSGVVIIGYNDSMSDKVLAEAVGSETLARGISADINVGGEVNPSVVTGNEELDSAIINAFSNANIPMTEGNIVDLQKAWDIVSSLKQPDDGSIAYMVENELKPTIWNFFIAENSGSVSIAASNNDGSLDEKVIDFTDKKNDTIVRQIENVISEAGLSGNSEEHDKALADAKWLLGNNLPVTADVLNNLKDIKDVAFPVSASDFADAAMAAVSRGENPIHANLTESESIYSLAAQYEALYFSTEMWEETAGDLTARRQLEEVRLSMTAEVNVKLIQSGFSIDTQPMEQLIGALKKAELQVANRYFDKFSGSEEEAISNYRLMNDTNKAVEELASGPAAAVGIFRSRASADIILREFHSESTAVRDTYVKAGESYEALMTAPRAGLGDRISKAFGNLDSLLASLGIEASRENLRAARILAYNRMEITADNLDKIEYADALVQSVVNKMTPASVLSMIRAGVNPLESSFESLSEYFDSNKEDEYKKSSKDYSEFLYGLDMQDAITPEERESYIGIYRMLHQIGKSEGAAIGAVVNEKAELDFNNLISAARSNRFKGIDVAISDEFGGTVDIRMAANSITDQIATAFTSSRQEREIAQLRETAEITKEVVDTLKQYDFSVNPENMSAMEKLISIDDNMFKEMAVFANKNADKKADKKDADRLPEVNGSLGEKTDDMTTNLKEMTARLEESIDSDAFDDAAAKVADDMDAYVKQLTFEADSYVDVKAMSLIHLQVGMMRNINSSDSIGDSKEYIIPYDTGVGIGKAHISFKSGEAGAAKLDIKSQADGYNIEAHISINGDRIEGYFVGNNELELQKMRSISDIFVEALRNSNVFESMNATDSGAKNLRINEMPVFIREGEASRNITFDDDYQSKDADGLHSEGTEKRVLLQTVKIFLQSVRKA